MKTSRRSRHGGGIRLGAQPGIGAHQVDQPAYIATLFAGAGHGFGAPRTKSSWPSWSVAPSAAPPPRAWRAAQLEGQMRGHIPRPRGPRPLGVGGQQARFQKGQARPPSPDNRRPVRCAAPRLFDEGRYWSASQHRDLHQVDLCVRDSVSSRSSGPSKPETSTTSTSSARRSATLCGSSPGRCGASGTAGRRIGHGGQIWNLGHRQPGCEGGRGTRAESARCPA